MTEDFRPAPEYRDMYTWTKEKVERVYGGAKGKSGMGYPRHKGLTQATNWAKQKFARQGKASFPCPDGGKRKKSPAPLLSMMAISPTIPSSFSQHRDAMDVIGFRPASKPNPGPAKWV